MILVGGVGSAAAYTYNLDVNIPNPGAISDLQLRIGMISFTVSGGDDPTYSLGSAVPSTGNWTLENFGGGWISLYDNFPLPLSPLTIAPLSASGRLLTITSNTELLFSDLDFSNYKGNSLSAGSGYFSTAGFTLDNTPVPIPAAIYLFGAGLIGLISIRRKA